jgi:hypothetical protein
MTVEKSSNWPGKFLRHLIVEISSLEKHTAKAYELFYSIPVQMKAHI